MRSARCCTGRRGSGVGLTSCATCCRACPSRRNDSWPSLVRGIFEQPDADQVWAMFAKVVEKLEERFESAAKLLDEAGADILAFTAFPFAHWRRIWSNLWPSRDVHRDHADRVVRDRVERRIPLAVPGRIPLPVP